MDSIEKDERLPFYMHLLLKIKEIENYPFTKLVIENGLSEEEYQEIVHLLALLNEKYEIQKEEGFLDYTSLLIQFAGMLNYKLDPEETIIALKKEGCYPELMEELSKIKRDF